MTRQDPHTTIRIDIQNRNGTFYITSSDVPGLWLWGKDPDDLFASVVPALKALYEFNEGLLVEVEEAEKPRTPAARWFSEGQICDTYNVYRVRNLRKHATV